MQLNHCPRGTAVIVSADVNRSKNGEEVSLLDST